VPFDTDSGISSCAFMIMNDEICRVGGLIKSFRTGKDVCVVGGEAGWGIR
jgi:hypothetical protein